MTAPDPHASDGPHATPDRRGDRTPGGRFERELQLDQLALEFELAVTRMEGAVADAEQHRIRLQDMLERMGEQFSRAERLRQDLSHLGESFATAYAQLRDVTEAIGHAERAAGRPPEHAVKRLKAMFEDLSTGSCLTPAAARVIERDVVRWGTEAYFGG